jgi:hypothetical protein
MLFLFSPFSHDTSAGSAVGLNTYEKRSFKRLPQKKKQAKKKTEGTLVLGKTIAPLI